MNIKVIVNYFGTPPGCFQLWLDSCAMNPQIEWLFYTDVDANKYTVPANVKFAETTLPELKDKIQKLFDYKIRYNSAWDFCALRGTFGLAFSDELVGADYWGWGDCDMVYGDLTPCIKAMRGADKVMPKGHLSFVRNDLKLNEYIVKHPLCHQAIAADEKGLPCFDEVAIPEVILPSFGARQMNGIPFINTACRQGHFVLDDTTALFNKLGVESNAKNPFVVTWFNGKMIGHFAMPSGLVEKVEVAYFHFFRRDMVAEVSRLLPNKHYLIVPNRIAEYDGHELSYEEITQLDCPRIHWAYWRKRMTISKILKKIFCR